MHGWTLISLDSEAEIFPWRIKAPQIFSWEVYAFIIVNFSAVIVPTDYVNADSAYRDNSAALKCTLSCEKP